MKHAVALFFLFIFSFQVLPAKALGKLIAKAQMTEEVKHSCDNGSDDGSGNSDDDSKDDDKDGKDEKDQDEKDESSEKYNSFFQQDRPTTEYFFTTANPGKSLIIWASENLIHLFTKDIHCPPPNC